MDKSVVVWLLKFNLESEEGEGEVTVVILLSQRIMNNLRTSRDHSRSFV